MLPDTDVFPDRFRGTVWHMISIAGDKKKNHHILRNVSRHFVP